MNKLIYKRGQIFLTVFSVLTLLSSFYFEYFNGLEPCPLCLMQRIMVFLLFLLCFIAVYRPSQRRAQIIAILQGLTAAGGLFFAGRQLWLQSLPPEQTPACMPGLDVLMRYFPWQDVLHALVWGAGDCAEISWQWLGLSMPAWAGLYFLFMLFSSFFVFWQLSRSNWL